MNPKRSFVPCAEGEGGFAEGVAGVEERED